MLAADIPEVARIEERQHPMPWHARSFEDALRCGWHTQVLRAAPEGNATATTVLGYFVAMTAGDDEELLTITVSPEAEGCGYGRQLLEALIESATHRGAQRLFLEVRESNARAIRLYESAGFTISGMRKNYYTMPADPVNNRSAGKEHAVLMVRELQQVSA